MRHRYHYYCYFYSTVFIIGCLTVSKLLSNSNCVCRSHSRRRHKKLTQYSERNLMKPYYNMVQLGCKTISTNRRKKNGRTMWKKLNNKKQYKFIRAIFFGFVSFPFRDYCNWNGSAYHRHDRIRSRIMRVEMKDGIVQTLLLICIIEMEMDSSLIANRI